MSEASRRGCPVRAGICTRFRSTSFFFTRRSLRTLLEAHGFHVVSLRAEASTYTLGYLVERLRKTLLGRPAPRAARWPGSGLRVPVNLFDIVTAQAVLSAPA